MRALLLSAALLVVMAAPRQTAQAQQQPATIPTELALVLLDHGESMFSTRQPQIVVGRVPKGIPSSLVPANGAVVVGGIEYSQMSILILAFTLPPGQVLKAYDEHLVATGWKPPPPLPTEGRGFVSNAYTSSWANIYCADSAAVQVSFSPAPHGGTYLRVENNRNREQSFCAQRQPSVYQSSLKFPALLPPAGISQQGGGGSYGGDDAQSTARLTGALDPSDIVAHYVRQLDSAGWRMGAAAIAGPVAVVPAEAKDSLGGRWAGALTAWRVSPFEVLVSLHMARPSPH